MWVSGAKAGYEKSGFLVGEGRTDMNVHLQVIMTANEKMDHPGLLCSRPSPAGTELERQLHIEFVFPCRLLFLGWSLSAKLS